MLGDKVLAGQYEVSIDTKTRIILPASTGREKDDLIFVVYDETMEHYKLYSKRSIEEIFDHYKKLILEAKTEKQRIYYKKEHLKFCKSILRQSHVDLQGRLVLGKIAEPGEKVNLIGGGDHLILERNKK